MRIRAPSHSLPRQPRTRPWNKVELLMKHAESGKWDWILWVDWDAMVADQTAMLRTIFENVLPEHVLIASGPPKEKPFGVQVFSSGVIMVKGDELGLELLEQWWYSWSEEARHGDFLRQRFCECAPCGILFVCCFM